MRKGNQRGGTPSYTFGLVGSAFSTPCSCLRFSAVRRVSVFLGSGVLLALSNWGEILTTFRRDGTKWFDSGELQCCHRYHHEGERSQLEVSDQLSPPLDLVATIS